MVRSEKLIELRNSWFFPKQLLGWRLEPRYGGRALNRIPWSLIRFSNQTPNTIFFVKAVRLRGLSSVVKSETAHDRRLRSLN